MLAVKKCLYNKELFTLDPAFYLQGITLFTNLLYYDPDDPNQSVIFSLLCEVIASITSHMMKYSKHFTVNGQVNVAKVTIKLTKSTHHAYLKVRKCLKIIIMKIVIPRKKKHFTMDLESHQTGKVQVHMLGSSKILYNRK